MKEITTIQVKRGDLEKFIVAKAKMEGIKKKQMPNHEFFAHVIRTYAEGIK